MNMPNNREFLDNLWRWKCGLPEKDLDESEETIDIESLKKSEWSLEFEKLMRNRLLMGSIRYGKMGHGSIPKGKPKYDRIKSIRKRLELFEKTKNLEAIIDIANMCLLIWEERSVDGCYFESVDDGYHDEVIPK